MYEEPVITKELKDWLGVEVESGKLELEKGHIQRFAQAVEDPNPIWQDRDYARKSRYGDIIAPPTFFQDFALEKLMLQLIEVKCPLLKHLYGGIELEFYKPMKLGDIYTSKAKLTDLYVKEGKGGKLLFMIVETMFNDQKGEPVVKGKHTFIRW